MLFGITIMPHSNLEDNGIEMRDRHGQVPDDFFYSKYLKHRLGSTFSSPTPCMRQNEDTSSDGNSDDDGDLSPLSGSFNDC